jgi:D-alanyl-D-alanine carboxypeptidase
MNSTTFSFLLRLAALAAAMTLLAGCAAAPRSNTLEAAAETAVPPAATPIPPTSTPLPPANTAIPLPSATAAAMVQTDASEAAPTPFYDGDVPDCGQTLPILSSYDGEVVSTLEVDPAARARVLELLPETAVPVLDFILESPDQVALVAYRAGQEAEGVSLNGDVPMPLASVVKILHLVAYAEAVAAGEFNPTATVAVADLDRYYLPTLDLRAHSDALTGLEEEGLLFGQPPALLLDGVVRMMIEYSSNAATDYLHMLLGQETIEETAVSLGLSSHTAPCPFLGQFLAMGNHARAALDDRTAVRQYSADPDRYAQEVMQLTAAFSEDEAFRQEAIAWRRDTRRPNGETQRLFSETLNAQATAAEYAGLMARLALNGLSNGESSYVARRHLEWPMRFAANQALFTNLGYKGGSLPGILTTAYYAYGLDGSGPVVVTLFLRDLERETYRTWRLNQAHDEFARWLLYEPEAIPALRALLAGA